MTTRNDGVRAETLRPRRSLARIIGVATAALGVPVLLSILWVTMELGVWPAILGIALALFLLSLLAWWQYRRTTVWVSSTGLVERGFFGLTRSAELEDIEGVVRVDLYRAHSLETTSQLFVIGRDGHPVLRMRGEFWEERDLDSVTRILGAAEVRRPEPVTLAELRRTDPELLYWFERIGPKG